MDLEKIVPEYHSNNFLVTWLFHKRLATSISLSETVLKMDGAKILDVGCGEGLLMKMIEGKYAGVQTFGMDNDKDVLALKGKVKGEVSVGDINRLEYADNTFDAAYCLDVLEHIEDLSKPGSELARVLKPGGLLIISGPTESPIYKLLRWVIKGTFSSIEGPAASPHLLNIYQIEKFFKGAKFALVSKKSLPLIRPLNLFNLLAFKNEK
ncbi:class I SAM-dependent methyltransferase [Candidatus Falkowbacteria bacterium]|nr:class I SAM-dependent methyltransferase [Candidatus Falkowbacteria bacterium]